MTAEETVPFAEWLRLREPADAAARAEDLLDALRPRLVGDAPMVIHDLGSGTGSMARWLATRLPGPQHWVLHDRDADLLARAAEGMTGIRAADGAPVTVRTRRGDLTRLTGADLADATLVTASALLDMLTLEEVERVVAACVGHPALFAVSVTGRVRLTPADPFDETVDAAFNDHQRRTVDGRRLLGPDAVAATVAAFTRHGVEVRERPSPWLLGPEHAELTAEWFTGWLGAACEQRPDLAGPARPYARRRLADAAAGRLAVRVEHIDLLAGG
ncbi:class I SAM-dependent methyltransferase [Micromonospora sp. WMMD1120]|uniref:methyltransferase domain-containing protein n=1 Tax=Micromonospora sp. WMMD1120 TaxID=3016106 RepID=UPI002416067A|nr:class I SAM-dependent methyltransferase [Micromonospora sp. WMMD1120]MDG4810442.1 class I SAM-dependent methyltransferase [Micromonospora sp. WMMD1120]